MRRWTIAVVGLLLTTLLVDSGDARGRRHGRRWSRVSSYSQPVANHSFSGDVQEIAQQKANLLAARGYGFHPGGYVGNYEGWGMGPTPQAARYGTCNGANCASARGSAVAWSERAQCYFAINIW